jgi:hypothetical protein
MNMICCGMTVKGFRIRCSSVCDDDEGTVWKIVTTNNEGGVSLMVKVCGILHGLCIKLHDIVKYSFLSRRSIRGCHFGLG